MAKEGKLLLIVDDNEADARFLERNLQRAGVSGPAEILFSGQESIEYLRRAMEDGTSGKSPLPSVIFLDLKLGDTSGFEVLQWITSHPPPAARFGNYPFRDCNSKGY